MELKNWLILGVALVTWGGVFLYMLRLGAIASQLEKELKDRELDR
jgi:CcmD family protein